MKKNIEVKKRKGEGRECLLVACFVLKRLMIDHGRVYRLKPVACCRYRKEEREKVVTSKKHVLNAPVIVKGSSRLRIVIQHQVM